MTKDTATAICNAADGLALDIAHRKDYSGRGMFGGTTQAVSGNRGDIMLAIVHAAYGLGEDGIDGTEFFDDMKNLRWDNLGRDEICY